MRDLQAGSRLLTDPDNLVHGRTKLLVPGPLMARVDAVVPCDYLCHCKELIAQGGAAGHELEARRKADRTLLKGLCKVPLHSGDLVRRRGSLAAPHYRAADCRMTGLEREVCPDTPGAHGLEVVGERVPGKLDTGGRPRDIGSKACLVQVGDRCV